MRVLYVAKHNSGGNDDEGAIAFALRKLGHDVVCVQERLFSGIQYPNADMLLCHHYYNIAELMQVRMPKVYWCFDLIDWPGMSRHVERALWAKVMYSACDLGFHTDGDWAAKYPDKLVWLTQGADNREVESWTIPPKNEVDVLFVGGLGYGRDKWVDNLRQRYGDRFKHIAKNCYGSALEYEVRSAKVVVAPPTPVTDRYWSNRVYNMLRFRAFLLHPHSDGLEEQYPAKLPTYKDGGFYGLLEEVFSMEPEYRSLIAKNAEIMTNLRHTYLHRCKQLIETARERLNLPA